MGQAYQGGHAICVMQGHQYTMSPAAKHYDYKKNEGEAGQHLPER
jgi:hypothetical protein